METGYNFDGSQTGTRQTTYELGSMIEYGDTDSEINRKNVLIVDDHYIVRRGLVELLSDQPDLNVCDAVATAEQALEVVDREPIDLAIIDISLGDADGITLTNTLKQKHPELIVLILSMHEEQLYGPRAVRAGASGFVPKQEGSDNLLEAIHQVLSGRTYFHSGS
jgi:DNA-binding NarL/FixJ family response regulator